MSKSITDEKSYKFKLRPKPMQRLALAKAVGCCRWVYNWGLEQRQALYNTVKELPKEERYEALKTCSRFGQDAQLTHLKKQFPFLAEAPANALQSVIHNLDKAYQGFFEGRTGFPDWKRKGEGDSFTEKSPNCFAINGEAVKLPKIGWVKCYVSRKVEGKLLNLTVTKDGGDWFVSITTRVTWEVEPPTGPPIAFDLGIAKSLAFSDRTEVHLPVATPKELRQKGRLQRAIARKQKGSKRRKKAVARLGNHERHICQRVNDSRNKITSSRANNHSLVIGEALRTCNMTRSAKGTLDEPGTNVRQKAGLNRGILAQGWGITRRQFAYKCRWRGGHYIEVDPRGTSQRCNECDHEEPANRPTQALFLCVECGYTENADFQSSDNLLEDGLEKAMELGLIGGETPHPTDGLAVAARRGPSGEMGSVEARTCGAKGFPLQKEVLALPAMGGPAR